MAEKFDLIADIREDSGKGASRRLRHQNKVPAIIYGAGRPPRALTFDATPRNRASCTSTFSALLKMRLFA
jgi:large subunit ribosomal protein L25